MKKVLIVLFVIVLGFQGVFAQTKEMTRAEKKAEKQKQEEVQWYQLKQTFDNKHFVFKGSILNSTRGTITLDPRINFISVQGDKAVVQFASGYGGGQNGIGGYTIDGLVNNYTVKAKKVGKGINVNLVIVPRVGQGVVSQPLNISINAFTFDSARLQIGSGSVFMQGEISESVDVTEIYQGNSPD